MNLSSLCLILSVSLLIGGPAPKAWAQSEDEPPTFLPGSPPNFPPPSDIDEEEFEEVEPDGPPAVSSFRPPGSKSRMNDPEDMPGDIPPGENEAGSFAPPTRSSGRRGGGGHSNGGGFTNNGAVRFNLVEGEFYERGKRRGRGDDRRKPIQK